MARVRQNLVIASTSVRTPFRKWTQSIAMARVCRSTGLGLERLAVLHESDQKMILRVRIV